MKSFIDERNTNSKQIDPKNIEFNNGVQYEQRGFELTASAPDKLPIDSLDEGSVDLSSGEIIAISAVTGTLIGGTVGASLGVNEANTSYMGSH